VLKQNDRLMDIVIVIKYLNQETVTHLFNEHL